MGIGLNQVLKFIPVSVCIKRHPPTFGLFFLLCIFTNVYQGNSELLIV